MALTLIPWEYLSLDVLQALSVLLISVAIAFFVFVVGYLHYQHRLYKEIPGPPRDSFFSGNLNTLRREVTENKRGACEVWLDWHIQYGSVFVFWVYHTAIVTVIDPELVKKVLIELNLPKAPRLYNILSYSYGERLAGQGILTELNHEVWKRQRVELNHAFHRTYLMKLMGTFNESCDVFLRKIGELADGKTKVRMTDEFARVTLDVIGKVGFGINTNCIEDANSPFPTAVSHILNGIQNATRNPFWRVKFWTFPYQERFKTSIRYLRQFAKEVISERLKGLNQHNDILAHILSMAEKNSDFSLEKVVDNFGTFFIAGQETTSNQLSFTLLEILKHPNIENRILEELQETLDSRHFVKYEDLGNLQYLGMTLKESLRLHPPIPCTQRMLLQEEDLGGYTIPAMTPINVSYFVTHNSPKFWENPEVFDPERFSVENKNGRSSTHFLPFSAGPRTCIGKTLAEFEAKLIMARLLQEFKLELVLGQSSSLVEQLTIKPRDGVVCTIRNVFVVFQDLHIGTSVRHNGTPDMRITTGNPILLYIAVVPP